MTGAIRCTRCTMQPEGTPGGFVVRNPYATQAGTPVHDPCPACEGSGYVPALILDAIQAAFPRRYDEIIGSLRWSYDHWSFTLAGMYVGVERDGYIHT